MDGNANKEILERKNHKHIPDSYSEVEVCKEKIANKHQRGKTTHTSLILILNLRVQVPKDGGRIALYEDLQVGRVGLLTQTRSTQECEEGPAGLHPIGPDPSTRKGAILCRVAKCHEYGGYIRVKKLEGWDKKSGRIHSFAKSSIVLGKCEQLI